MVLDSLGIGAIPDAAPYGDEGRDTRGHICARRVLNVPNLLGLGLANIRPLAGRIAESVAGYFLRSILNLDVAHFPERGSEPEVDFVLSVGEQRIPVEVKYRRRINHNDTSGLRSFIEKAHYNAPFGVLVTLTDEVASDDPRIVSLPLSSLLLMR